MKFIYLLLLAGFTATAQTNVVVNVLTESTFEAIQINGYSLSQIKNIHGEESQIVNLFGVPDEKKISTVSGASYEYYYNEGFEIGFSTLYGGNATLGSFEINDSTMIININGVSFSVGDNISTLSPLNLNENTGGNYENGVKGFLFAPCSRCDETVYIHYNTLTQKIIKVGYFEPT